MGFVKAEKSKSKLRCAMFGPPGAGKTYSALAIAKGIGGKVAVIDSERGSASKYADRFDFDVVELETMTIDEYKKYMVEASGVYDVLIIDSMTHAWGKLVEEIDELAKKKYNGNSFRAWAEGTPTQRKFIDALYSFKGHIIATMRSKIEWVVSKDDATGKTTIERKGLKPDQGKNIEYEFDLLLDINDKHCATVLKDRTGKFQDKFIDKPGEKFGKELNAWLKEGKTNLHRLLFDALNELEIKGIREEVGVAKFSLIPIETIIKCLDDRKIPYDKE